VSAWLKRFSLHLVAAVGAVVIFAVAVAVGAVATTPSSATAQPTAASVSSRPRATPVLRPERSLAGTLTQVDGDVLVVTGRGGRTWRVQAAPGALIRLNGKSARLDALQPGESVVILGQAGPGSRFLAHAITAKTAR
jgi:hypothetical protein